MQELRTVRLREPAWRIHPDPTALPSLPAEGEAPPNRFDDPEREYRVRYLATNKRGAFLEVLARFRIDSETQARLGAVTAVDEKTEPKISPGAIPKAFLSALREGTGQVVAPKHEFVDVAAKETQAALNKHARVRRALADSGLGKQGSPAVLNDETIRLGGAQGRPITQAVSRVVFDETPAVGIRYVSRLDATEPCWAVFDWVEMKFSKTTPINAQDAALKSAALSLGLTLP